MLMLINVSCGFRHKIHTHHLQLFRSASYELLDNGTTYPNSTSTCSEFLLLNFILKNGKK